MSKNLLIYTDGACSYNPGPGGYAYIILSDDNKIIKTYSEGFAKTTNNRMELLAVINALKNIADEETTLFSDSRYVIDSINNGWVYNWQKNWGNRKNKDLWIDFLQISKNKNIKYVWVQGHNESKYNNECDLLARKAIKTFLNGK